MTGHQAITIIQDPPYNSTQHLTTQKPIMDLIIVLALWVSQCLRLLKLKPRPILK
jgi:hypothetical protein